MIRRLYVLLSLLLVAACSGPQAGPSRVLKSRADQSLITVYMSASGAAELDVKFRLEDIAVAVDGVWVGLGLEPVEIDFLKLKGQQSLIGAAIAPLGQHRKLQLRVSGLSVETANEKQTEQLFEILLPDPLELRSGDSKCLFVDLQLIGEKPRSRERVAHFTARGQGQVLGGELLYIACQDINTVYLVRMDINDVVSAFGVPGPLADIRILADQRRLYILSAGRRSIYIYDCLNDRLVDQIVLPGSISPQHMALSGDGDFAFVTDPVAGTVFKIDLLAGNLMSQARIGFRPQRLIYIAEGQGRLAIAAPRSNQVIILNADNLKTMRIIPVGLRPAGLLLFDDALYVAESGSQSVAVFNYQTGAQKAKITVGLQPDDLVSVDRTRAYVSNSGEGRLTVLQAGQNMAFKRLAAGQNPTEMAFSKRKQLLYVENPSAHTVTVIDRAADNILKQIRLGAAPRSMAILE